MNKPKGRRAGGSTVLWSLVLGIIIVAVGLGSYWFLTGHSQGTEPVASALAGSDLPAFILAPASEDLGEVSMRDGVVTTEFEISNAGTGNLILNNIKTSCGCTSAAVVVQGQEGPRFAMAMGNPPNWNPTDWSVVLEPGEQAKLKVYYDPARHPDLRGPVTRVVRVYSNDPAHPYLDARIELVAVQ